jgi:phenylalanine-4-hydroxylase
VHFVGKYRYIIKTDLREVGWTAMDWIDLAQDRETWRALVKAVNELLDSIRCREIVEYLRNC